MSIFGTPLLAPTALGSGTSLVTTTGINTQVGDLLVALVTASGTAGATLTGFHDTAGNTFTIVGSPSTSANGTGAGSIFVAYCLSATHASATNKFTATFGLSQGFSLMYVWDVPITGTVLFDTTSLKSTVSASGTPTTNQFSTSGTDEFVAFIATNINTGQTYTKQSGWTLDSAAFASGTGGSQHILFSSAQTNITADMTTSSSNYTVGIAAFKAMSSSPIAASIAGTATVSATGVAYGLITGAIVGHANVTASVQASGALIGAIAGRATVGAILVGSGSLASSIDGQATVTGGIQGLAFLIAGINGTGTVVADSEAIGALVAAIQGDATVTASLIGIGELLADISGAATVSGTAAATGFLSCDIFGFGTVTADVADVPGAIGCDIFGSSSVSASGFSYIITPWMLRLPFTQAIDLVNNESFPMWYRTGAASVVKLIMQQTLNRYGGSIYIGTAWMLGMIERQKASTPGFAQIYDEAPIIQGFDISAQAGY